MRLARLVPALLLALAPPLLGQGAVAGTVVDAVSARPLIGAIVTLRLNTSARVTRTDETGAFAFGRVAPGTYTLATQRLGYDPVIRSVEVAGDSVMVNVAMSRIAQLDTVRVRAARQAIYGVVGTAAKLEPIRHAAIQIIGTGFSRLKVDSTGRFFAEIRTPGVYLVRANAEGYTSGTVSVTVPLNDGVEVAMLLDTTSGADHVLAHAFADFQERVIRLRPMGSAMVGRGELTRYDDDNLTTAIMRSPSFAKKALRFTDEACLFVDGRPRPGVSLQAIDPADVEIVEVYTTSGDASRTLGNRWPRGMACGATGMPRASGTKELIKWVTVWQKR